MVDRLQVFEDSLTDAVRRIGKLEDRMDVAETTREEMRRELLAKLDTIETFVGGYNKIWGLAKKHWKTLLTFGAGLVTATGAGNPTVQATANYIGKFFGVH